MPPPVRRPINFARLLPEIRAAAAGLGAGDRADALARSLVRAAERLSAQGVGRVLGTSNGDRRRWNEDVPSRP
jgi:hypothetical protein